MFCFLGCFVLGPLGFGCFFWLLPGAETAFLGPGMAFGFLGLPFGFYGPSGVCFLCFF